MNTEILDFSKDYTLENNRVRLSPLQLMHLNALVSIANDKDVWTYFLENGLGFNNLKSYVQSAILKRINQDEYPFIIFDKQTHQYAGMTRLYDFNPELATIKIGHTWYGKQFWGTGLNKHCKFLLFQFCFESLEVARIGFGVHGENLRSIYALKNIGCQQEGRLRSFLKKVEGIGRTDLLLFSLLKEEWLGGVKNQLATSL